MIYKHLYIIRLLASWGKPQHYRIWFV